jgi:hypothetical protein
MKFSGFEIRASRLLFPLTPHTFSFRQPFACTDLPVKNLRAALQTKGRRMMSGVDEKPIVNIPSLEELEQMVLESLRQEVSPASQNETQPYSWEDFIDN